MASVIVAEDDLDHQRIITEVLRRLGHDVTLVADGHAGLEEATKHRPDLVIADVDMPRLNGLQMCQAIRDDPALADLPVLIVTALLPPSDPALVSSGATGYLRKPFRVQELRDAVQAQLFLQSAARANTATAGPTSEPMFTEALLQSLQIGVAVCDTDGRLVVFNQALRRFFGDDAENLPVHQWPQRYVLHRPDGIAATAEELPLIRALAGEQVEPTELLAYDQDERARWLSIDAHPIHDRSSVIVGAVATVQDVTAEHDAQRYQDCKSAVLKVLARTPDTATAGGQILQAMASTLGWPYMRLWRVDPVTDRLVPIATYTAPGAQPLPIPESISCGEGLAGVCWQRGELMWVPEIHADDSPLLPNIIAASPYRAAGAVPIRTGEAVTGVMTFFSHRRQELEPALAMLLTGIAGNVGAYLEHRRADELALQLAASTDEYLALVGHELRTPLTSIGAYAELIADSPDNTTLDEIRDMVDAITRSNSQLRHLVDQLLDLAAVEAGHAPLTMTTIDLPTLTTDAVGAIEPTCRDRGITITIDLPAPLPVPGDADRLRQVLDHLLSNAASYSPDDSTITISATRDGDTAVLTITDQGTGIPTNEHPKLFRRLYRGSNARHTGIPGAGLGLALTRAILARHQGTITLTPADPAGTTATIRLPGTSNPPSVATN
jgi:PAS domain S-box-containing protein